MKIRLNELKELILQELAVSPALFRQPADPLSNKNVAKALHDLEASLHDIIVSNLMYDQRDAYNQQTREFDDAVYKRIMSEADTASRSLTQKIKDSITQMFQMELK